MKKKLLSFNKPKIKTQSKDIMKILLQKSLVRIFGECELHRFPYEAFLFWKHKKNQIQIRVIPAVLTLLFTLVSIFDKILISRKQKSLKTVNFEALLELAMGLEPATC